MRDCISARQSESVPFCAFGASTLMAATDTLPQRRRWRAGALQPVRASARPKLKFSTSSPIPSGTEGTLDESDLCLQLAALQHEVDRERAARDRLRMLFAVQIKTTCDAKRFATD